MPFLITFTIAVGQVKFLLVEMKGQSSSPVQVTASAVVVALHFTIQIVYYRTPHQLKLFLQYFPGVQVVHIASISS